MAPVGAVCGAVGAFEAKKVTSDGQVSLTGASTLSMSPAWSDRPPIWTGVGGDAVKQSRNTTMPTLGGSPTAENVGVGIVAAGNVRR